ncbi:MAG: M23 family metallopeptidase [Saprospiraceae bacterium]|nr:M23 family metallopeptidase [Saprospiraceae bacterium]
MLCPAHAVVEEVILYVEDNPVGAYNTRQNWGNTIVLKHAEGLYTKLSHLRKGSIKVVKGEYVKKGMLLAACGNSGRSPEPHLHFQVQTTPYIGSRTLAYPFASYILHDTTDKHLPETFTTPREEAVVSNIQLSLPGTGF